MRFTIFDRWGNPLGDIPDVISANRVRATDATDTLDVTCLGEINKDERIVFADSMGRWCEYVCQGSETKRASGIPVTVAYCAGSIAELSRSYIEDKRNRDADAKSCLVKALDGTRWEAGTVDLGTTLQSADLSFYHCTVLEAIQNIADTYGLEIETEYQPTDDGNAIGRRIIHMLDRRGQTNPSRRFEYGKDLTEISRDVDSADVITRLYGWGKGVETTDESGNATGGYGRKIDFSTVNNGKKYVEDATATQNWGIPGPDGTRQPSVGDADFTDCDDPTELLALTKAQLKTLSTPVVSYEATVAALQKAGMGVEGVDVGDEVQIVDTAFAAPLRLEGRVLKIDEDLVGSLADTKITLGNIRQTYTQRLSAQQQQLDKLVSSSGAWNDAASGTGPYMRDLIDRINEIMNATGGYAYMKPGIGIMVYDKPEDQNPTQAIQIGGGFWRIADKKKPNGDWDFRSLANGHGIFADTLFTGMLHDAAGYNYWNLDTGEFSLSARSTIGGSTLDSHLSDTLGEAKTDAATKANSALSSAKTYADTGDSKTLASAKTFATSEAESHVNTLDKELTQLEIFNRLTQNGQTQGIYMLNGLLYLDATYMRTGIITGKRSYWNLDTGQFSMNGPDGTVTVYLNGDTKENLLSGTFRTATSGNRVEISPNFEQQETSGTDEFEGAGIQFFHGTTSYSHPYIAVESTSKEEGEISALTFNSGHRAKNDPGSFMRIGERKAVDNTTKEAVGAIWALRNYDETNASDTAGAKIGVYAYDNSTKYDTNADIRAYDRNGYVGIEANINSGYLYLGGFLGTIASRGTFQKANWRIYTRATLPPTTTIPQTNVTWTPAKYGHYYGVANVDVNWGSMTIHVCNTSGSSGIQVMGFVMGGSTFKGDVYCNVFAWLVK